MGYNHFVRRFIASDLGKIVAANAVDGCEMGHYTHETLRDMWSRAYTKGVEGEGFPFNEYIRRFSESANNSHFGSQMYDDLLELKETLTVVWPEEIIPYLATGEDLKRLSQASMLLPGERGALTQIAEKERYFSLKEGGCFGQAMFWFTQFTPNDEELNDACSSKAELYRDRLGLIHYAYGKKLVALKVPSSILKDLGVDHARPTFVEAGEHTRFMAKARGAEGGKPVPYGRTVDLCALSTHGSLQNGEKERVAKAIPASQKLTEIKIYFEALGEVTSTRGISALDNDAAYSHALIGDRMEEDLYQYITGQKQ